MFSKLFIMLLAAYAVNASAININIFTDAGSSDADVSLSDCNNRACNQLCLRLGFTGGVCVGNSCKCDNFKKINNGDKKVSQQRIATLDCNNSACDQLCRIYGFKDGTCAEGRCKCEVFNGKNDGQILKVSNDCNNADCIVQCQGLNYIGGICIGEICSCI